MERNIFSDFRSQKISRIPARLSAIMAVCGLLMTILVMPVSADFPEVLAQAKKGIAQLYVLGDDGRELWGSIGTGFAVGKAGEDSDTFLTNWHVVTIEGRFSLEQTRIWILRENCTISEFTGEPDPTRSVECEVLKTTSGNPDYAIIRAKSPLGGYQALPLLSSKEIQDGTHVYTLGYPGIVGKMSAHQYGIDDITATDGIVSQHMQFVLADNTWVLMHTAQISGGSSGGPLITENGAVVGINTFSFGEDEGNANRYCSVYIDYAMEGLDELGISYDLYTEEKVPAHDADSVGSEQLVQIIAVVFAAATAAAVAVAWVLKKRKPELPPETERPQEEKLTTGVEFSHREDPPSEKKAGGARVRINMRKTSAEEDGFHIPGSLEYDRFDSRSACDTRDAADDRAAPKKGPAPSGEDGFALPTNLG